MSVLMADQRDSTAQAVLRCRGLPFTATHNELLEFFEGFNIIESLITKADGEWRHSGPHVHHMKLGVPHDTDCILSPEARRVLQTPQRPEISTNPIVFWVQHRVAFRGCCFGRLLLLLTCMFDCSCATGKPNGQAFVLLPSAEAIKAQVELNNKYMGKRFIE